MAKFRFATDGFRTVVELDGATIGDGVSKVEFSHEAGMNAKLKLEIDVYDFHFLPDGEFDKKESVLMGRARQNTDDFPAVVTAQ